MPELTPSEVVELVRALRAEGVSTFKGLGIACRLLPAPPTEMDNIRERLGEMSPEERERLLEQAQKDLKEDLYGATGR